MIDLKGINTVLQAPHTKGRSKAIDRKWVVDHTDINELAPKFAKAAQDRVLDRAQVGVKPGIFSLSFEEIQVALDKAAKYDKLMAIIKQ